MVLGQHLLRIVAAVHLVAVAAVGVALDRATILGMDTERDVDADVDEQRERYRELLEELRTVIPGVQVLFAFLLTAPFSSRFDELDGLGVQMFAVSLISVGLATVVLLTPTAYHRLTPRQGRSQRIKLGVRVALAGMLLLTIAVGTSVFVVGRLVFTTHEVAPAGSFSATTIGTTIAALVAGTAVALWFVLPFIRRYR